MAAQLEVALFGALPLYLGEGELIPFALGCTTAGPNSMLVMEQASQSAYSSTGLGLSAHSI